MENKEIEARIRKILIEDECTFDEAIKRIAELCNEASKHLTDDLINGKAMIVYTGWIEEHDKRMINKACDWWKEYLEGRYRKHMNKNIIAEIIALSKKALEDICLQ